VQPAIGTLSRVWVAAKPWALAARDGSLAPSRDSSDAPPLKPSPPAAPSQPPGPEGSRGAGRRSCNRRWRFEERGLAWRSKLRNRAVGRERSPAALGCNSQRRTAPLNRLAGCGQARSIALLGNMSGLLKGGFSRTRGLPQPRREPAVKNPLLLKRAAAWQASCKRFATASRSAPHHQNSCVKSGKKPRSANTGFPGWLEGRRTAIKAETPRAFILDLQMDPTGRSRIGRMRRHFVGVVAIAMAHGIHQGLLQAQMQDRQIADLAIGLPAATPAGGRRAGG